MCGILAVIGDYRYKEIPEALIERGRDDNGIYQDDNVQLMQTRLQITGKDKIDLPFQYGDWVLLYNGEVYNYEELNKSFLYEFEFKYDSDFETVLFGFIKYGNDFIKLLDGQFMIFIYNKKTKQYFTFTDEMKIRTAYKVEYKGSTIISSNLRSLPEMKFQEFPCKGYGNVTKAIEL